MSPSTFVLVQIVTTAAGVLAGGAVLWRAVRRRERIGVFALSWALVWTACGSAVATFVLRPVGISAFGVIRMLFLAGVVGAPAVGASALAVRIGRRVHVTAAATALAALTLLAAPLGAYMSFVAPQELRVEHATVVVDSARAGHEPIRIGILADLQCNSVGEHETAAVDALLAEKPDLILVPGDIFQRMLDFDTEWDAAREPLLALLARVRAPYGVYFVVGDVDTEPVIAAIRKHTDWTVLMDETVHLRVRDHDVRIAGATRPGAVRVGEALERIPGKGDIRILMTHAPDTILGLESPPRADLFVAGHTHGGQVVVPGFGPPMTLSNVPRPIAQGGLHIFRGRATYVSRGVGIERNQAPPMRLFCPPEISIVTLTSAPPEQP